MRFFLTQSRLCKAEFDEDLHAIAATVKGRVFIMLSSTIFLLHVGTSELRVIEGYSTQQRKSYLCRVIVSYPDPHRSCGWNTSPPTRVVGLVSSCTNFCPVAPECCSDQSDLRYALIAYSSHQSKLSVMAVRLEIDDVQVIRAIQSAGERMGYAKVKDEQFRVIEDVVRGRDTFVSLPTQVTAF